MKQNFITLKKKMYRGISFLLCLSIVLSICPIFSLKASAAIILPNPFSTSVPRLTYITYDASRREYKATGGPNDFIDFHLELSDISWNNDQLAMLQSGGARAYFKFSAWTGTLWSWYTAYIQYSTKTSYEFIFPTDAEVPVATVYCSSFGKNFEFYESKNHWTTHTI